MAGGRPTKLSTETQDAICKALSGGNTREDAAIIGGISYRAMCYWLARGRKSKHGPYFQFVQAIKKAETTAVEGYVAVIKKAALERTETTTKKTVNPDGSTKEETTTRRVFDWCAAAWWLERRRPEDFGKREIEALSKLTKQISELEAKVASLTAKPS